MELTEHLSLGTASTGLGLLLTTFHCGAFIPRHHSVLDKIPNLMATRLYIKPSPRRTEMTDR